MLNKLLVQAYAGNVQDNSHHQIHGIEHVHMVNIQLQMNSIARFFNGPIK